MSFVLYLQLCVLSYTVVLHKLKETHRFEGKENQPNPAPTFLKESESGCFKIEDTVHNSASKLD